MIITLLICCILIVSIITLITVRTLKRNLSSKVIITSFKKTYMKTGLPIIYVTFKNNKQYAFIVDTGANANIISSSVLEEALPKATKKSATNISHVNGIQTNLHKTDFVFNINKHSFKETFIVTEFTDAYSIINQNGNVNIAGILGSKFLNKYNLKVIFKNYTITK